jgi:mannose-6-phosphate isomerase-like protein (cupin superfamily)
MERPMKPISINDAPHYTWGDVCDGWHLAKTDALSVIQECVPPGAKETRHLHHHAEQFFYVLSGVATMEAEGEVHHLGQGQGIHIPAGRAHQLSNQGSEDTTFIVVSTPPSHGDREMTPDAK